MACSVRIAVAAFFALLALAFIALWVRSYSWHDELVGEIGESDAICTSSRGIIFVGLLHWELPRELQEWHVSTYPLRPRGKVETFLGLGFLRQGGWGPTGLLLPHWFLAASSLALAALFTFKRTWRFSVRSILIATTVVAALLGAIVYLL